MLCSSGQLHIGSCGFSSGGANRKSERMQIDIRLILMGFYER
jgi:hypothetical protein